MIRRAVNWRHVANELAMLSAAALLVAFAWAVVVFLFAAEVAQ